MREQTISAVTSLKELVIILSGLTIVSSIGIITTDVKNVNLGNEALFSEKSLLLFFLIINVVRFYHGNMRLIDDKYVNLNVDKPQRRLLWLDYWVIFLTSVLFAAMGAFIDSFSQFFSCLMIILLIDIFWLVFCISSSEVSEHKIQIGWILNNFVLFLVILLAKFRVFEFAGSDYNKSAILIGGFASTLIDFLISWSFYFPGSILPKAKA